MRPHARRGTEGARTGGGNTRLSPAGPYVLPGLGSDSGAWATNNGRTIFNWPQESRSAALMICRSSWVRTGVAALLGVACSSTVCTAQEDYEYEWTCTEAPRAMPCMDGVPCPREDVSNRFACQSLCEDTAGCFSIVFDSSSNECYLKGEDSASAVQAERCTRTPKASAEDDTSRWDDVDCLLWGAGCSAASPLPWLMAVFFGM